MSSKENVLLNPVYGNIKLEEGKYTGSYFIAETNRFQSVYSSQNYGSFFELYIRAKFLGDSDDNFVEFFEFRIINYKGPLNVGFADLNEKKDELYFNKTDGVLGLRILVSGRNNKNMMRYKIPESWEIGKDNLKQLNIYRMLVPMYGLNIGNTNNEVFDSEFYERSGLEIGRRKIVPDGHYDFDKPMYFGPDIEKIADPKFFDNILNITKNGNPIKIKSKDSNCYTSTMYVK